MTDEEAHMYFHKCASQSYRLLNYFDRPEFEGKLQTFINDTFFGLIMGANSIGKTYALKKYAKEHKHVIYFDLKMYLEALKFWATKPCSIIAVLSL